MTFNPMIDSEMNNLLYLTSDFLMKIKERTKETFQ